ncbi:tyrosine-type recombinase/integrase [Loktanella sp. 3ANDIMAR09]|uniref:tyrosine-type recombinase/integrase n=1 Tax=Loktanella sp. 3ANDIMAR09 TaxID=1225657 RepID=UPI0009F8764A|nr:tyrosine-type recombinase/integrase [Loktanella sp. 3ANDIMAR09]
MGQRNRGGAVKLRFISRSGTWPSGHPRCYYRPKGRKGIALPDLPMDHPAFLRAYAEAAGGDMPLAATHLTGSLGAGVLAYQSSDIFRALSPTTRDQRRRTLDKLRRAYGDLRLSGLRSRHIRKDIAQFDPNPANSRLKVWRALGRYWLDAGLLDMDPARDVRPKAVPKTDGHAAWSRDDLDTFRAHWPIGTPQRLAMELIYQTCAAIGDACKIGKGHVSHDGWITYRRSKSQTMACSPALSRSPEWFEGRPDLLQACIDRAPRALTYLATTGNRPRSPKAATGWFADACRKAGLDDGKTAHGLRKLRAAMMREMGATKDQRMAVLGHETETEADHYARSADLRRVITGTESSNLSNSGPTDSLKGLK